MCGTECGKRRHLPPTSGLCHSIILPSGVCSNSWLLHLYMYIQTTVKRRLAYYIQYLHKTWCACRVLEDGVKESRRVYILKCLYNYRAHVSFHFQILSCEFHCATYMNALGIYNFVYTVVFDFTISIPFPAPR